MWDGGARGNDVLTHLLISPDRAGTRVCSQGAASLFWLGAKRV